MPRRTYDPRNGRRRVPEQQTEWTWLRNELARLTRTPQPTYRRADHP